MPAGGPLDSITRIAVVGPVEPFRSGIARHTTALARALQRRPGVRVQVTSFVRQYPALLFPGRSDRADDTPPPRDLDVDERIDSLNPLTWMLAARTIQRFRPHLVIAPAWTFFLAPCFAYILAQLRRRRITVLGLVHNIADHDATRLRAAISALQLRQADAYITHTHELASGIARLVPGARVQVQLHPVLDYPTPRGLLPRRAELELLMFGIVRAYKGLDVLLRGLALAKHGSIRLSVVGEIWKDAGDVQRLIEDLGVQDQVELVPRYVADAEAAEYFARADVVVLPYRSVSGSGVLPLAFYYGKPVAAADLAGFSELVEDGETGWLLPVGDAGAWADAIDRKLSRAASEAMGAKLRSVRARLTFDGFAEAVLSAARMLDAAKAFRAEPTLER